MGEQGKVRGQGRSKCHVDGEEGWTSRGGGGTGTRICPAEGVKLSVSKHPYVSALLGLAKRTHQALIHGKTVL